MKLAVGFALVALIAVASFMMSHRAPKLSPEEAARVEWRRTTGEKVTAVRPERYEALKWHPDQDQDVELRAPASAKKSH